MMDAEKHERSKIYIGIPMGEPGNVRKETGGGRGMTKVKI